jgi:hypothetical protein
MRKSLLLLLVLTLSTFVVMPAQQASAIAVNYNNVISDNVFDNTTSMNAAQIDAFLNTFPSSCISSSKGFVATDPTGYSPSGGFRFGGNVSAGTAIYHAAQGFEVNPQVLIATLQKEQSLVSGTAGCYPNTPDKTAAYQCDLYGTGKIYNCTGACPYGGGCVPIAVGYGCPGKCNADQEGFSQQIVRAAWRFSLDRHRAEGQSSWYVNKPNWDSSDDASSCYSGPMTQGTYRVCPNGAASYYDGYYTTKDPASVHIDNGATAALYHYTPFQHGQSLFFTNFTNWFGSTQSTDLVRTADNATVYLLSGSTKYPIGSMDTLSSLSVFGPVSFVPNAMLDNYTLGKAVGKSILNNGTVYFINSGIKLAFTSCAQLTSYGLACGQEVPLTDFQTAQFATGPNMTSLYKTTSGRLFYISSGQKHEVFDNQSLSQAGINDGINTLQDNGINYLPYGSVVGRDGVVVRSRDTGVAYLYDSSNYIALKGEINNLGSLASLAHVNLDDASIATAQRVSSFTGFVKNSSGSAKYVLLDTGKAVLSSAAEWTSTYTTLSDTTLQALSTSAEPINSRLVKSTSNGTVYYVLGGQKRPIPSWTDLVNLKAQPLSINTMATWELDTVPAGRLIYAPGTMVKTNGSATVYVVKSDTELLPITSFLFPQELGAPSLLETMSTADLGNYTVGSNLYTKISCGGQDYIGISGTLYPMDAAALAQFGFVHADFMDVGSPLCSVLPQSSQSPPVFLLGSNGTIYLVQSGAKHAFTGYGAYVAHGGTSQNTVKVSDYFLGLITTGSNITQ